MSTRVPDRWSLLGVAVGMALLAPPAAAQIAPGVEAPALAFTGSRNTPWDLAELSDLCGAVVLLEFSATWCGPCAAQVPHLNALHGKYASRGLVVLGVMDEEAKKVEPWLERLRVQHPVGTTAAGHGMTTYGIRAIPTAVLVDAAGKVVWVGHPGKLDAEIVEQALAGASNPLLPLGDQLAPVQDLLDRGLEGKALAMLQRLLQSGRLDPAALAAATAVQQRLERRAARLLQRAADLAAEEPFQAALLLQELVLRHGGHEVAATAADRLGPLAADPAGQRRVAAALAVARARALALARRYDEAIAAYEQARNAGDPVAQAFAAAAIGELEARGLRGFRAECPGCRAAGRACAAHERR